MKDWVIIKKSDEDLLHSLRINPDDAYVLKLFSILLVRT